jgi:hypothetical protein
MQEKFWSVGRRLATVAVLLGLPLLGMPMMARATITLTPINHATLDETTSPDTIYYPIQGTSPCDQAHTYPPSLVPIDPAASTGLQFKIVSDKDVGIIFSGTSGASVQNPGISVHAQLGNNSIELIGGTYKDASHLYVDYGTSTGAEVSTALRLDGTNGFCPNAFTSGATGSTTCQQGRNAGIQSASVTIGVIRTGDLFSSSNTNPDSAQFNIVAVDCPPHDVGGGFTFPQQSFTLIPGDQRVKLVNLSTAPSDPVGIKAAVVYATTNSSRQPTTGNTSDPMGFQRQFANLQDTYLLDGLANNTQYCFGVAYVNRGGLVSTDSNWSANISLSPLTPPNNCATPSQVDGFLDRSTCFIASAAYGDEWNPKLELLREFRDQILERSKTGHRFVQWYYSWSPKAAYWLFENPGYKTLVRAALFPLVEAARVALWLRNNMWILGVLFLFGTAVVLKFRRSMA